MKHTPDNFLGIQMEKHTATLKIYSRLQLSLNYIIPTVHDSVPSSVDTKLQASERRRLQSAHVLTAQQEKII